MSEETRKPYVVDRAQIEGVLACTSTEDSRYVLNGVNVRPDCLEASNGHVLVRIPHQKIENEEFPSVAGAPTEAPIAPFVVPADLLRATLKAIQRKAHLPILGCALLGISNGNVIAAATDLETSSIPSARRVEQKFPNTEKLIPKDMTPLFALAVPELERLCKVAKAGKRWTPMLMFYTPKDRDSAIRVEIPFADDRKALAVIMPIRAEWPEMEAGKPESAR